MQSLRGIVIIKGKPTLAADLMGALCKRRKDICEYLTLSESTGTKATYRTKRVGEPDPTVVSFTLDDAKAAGLVSAGGMYTKYPRQMLRARCLAEVCRAVYPDLCMGLYDPEELGAEPPQPPPEPRPERDVNPAPQPPPSAGVLGLKAQLSAKAVKAPAVIDVQPGETEQQATERQAPKKPWARIVEAGARHGKTEAEMKVFTLTALQGKKSVNEVDAAHVIRLLEDSLVFSPDAPPHSDEDAPGAES